MTINTARYKRSRKRSQPGSRKPGLPGVFCFRTSLGCQTNFIKVLGGIRFDYNSKPWKYFFTPRAALKMVRQNTKNVFSLEMQEQDYRVCETSLPRSTPR